MAYQQVQVKPDDAFNMKFIYRCTVRGCSEEIYEYPVSEKNPSPKYRKFHARGKITDGNGN